MTSAASGRFWWCSRSAGYRGKVRDTLTISEQLDTAGANLASRSESIDTMSASGRMAFKMLSVLAEFERELLSERTSSAMRQMANRGERVGRYAQFGYRLSPDGAMRVCPEEQNVIAMIRRLGPSTSTPLPSPAN